MNNKVVLNMTTLNQGGVLQRAVSFIGQLALKFGDYDWHLLVSDVVKKQLDTLELKVDFPIKVFSESPARNTSARRNIADVIHKIRPDFVFTFAGPSYLKLDIPELMGVADGWVTHGTPTAFKSVASFRDRWGLRIASYYKLRWFRQNKWFINQTQTGRKGIIDRFGAKPERVFIVPNALANWYKIAGKPTARLADQKLRIFYFAAAYSHKRHDLIPEVCRQLKQLGETNFEIVITIPDDNPIAISLRSRAKKLGVASHIVNMGSVPVNRGIKLYEQSHVCFMPSVLETFSATYLEAMATRTPIVASDFEFAREICGDAALYFSSGNALDAARKILEFAQNEQLSIQKTDDAILQFKKFPNIDQQMAIYRQTFEKMLNSI